MFKEKWGEAYNEFYFEALKDKSFGFTHSNISEMLEHLKSQYLVVTSREKNKRLK